jgi:hypothetical protein
MTASPPLPCGYRSRARVIMALRPGRLYREPASGLEVRCLRAGHGRLTYAGQTVAAS